jgi:hypothetical protein
MLLDLNQLTKEVRDTTGIPLEEVRSYAKFMFKFIVDTMEKGDYESVSLQYLCTFKALPARLHHLEEKGIKITDTGKAIVEQYRRKKNENN